MTYYGEVRRDGDRRVAIRVPLPEGILVSAGRSGRFSWIGFAYERGSNDELLLPAALEEAAAAIRRGPVE